MDALPMNKTECLQAYLQGNGTPYDKLVIGALIFNRADWVPKILMLKRAAHEKNYPNLFEIPGGKVEDSDHTILDTVQREVYEEASLKVKEVLGCVNSFDYCIEKKTSRKDGGEESVWSTSLQLNFICEVAEYGLSVDPEEHSEGKFISHSEIGDLEMTEQMRAVVEEGFIWIEGYLTGLSKAKV
ncbi:MAG: hypothetical protein Q9171_001829 [Xanthocarpia ochracea]